MARIIETVALSALVATSAHAQLNTIEFKVSNLISPKQPTATVEAWALWDPAQYAFWRARFDVLAAADPGAFSNPERMLKGPGTWDGDVAPDGDAVMGVVAGQVHYPAQGIFADESNPIPIWRATWGTSHFAPRLVDLHTATTGFDLYVDDAGNGVSFLDQFTEGSGVIQVVPAPAAFAALTAGVGLATRRRRAAG